MEHNCSLERSLEGQEVEQSCSLGGVLEGQEVRKGPRRSHLSLKAGAESPVFLSQTTPPQLTAHPGGREVDPCVWVTV